MLVMCSSIATESTLLQIQSLLVPGLHSLCSCVHNFKNKECTTFAQVGVSVCYFGEVGLFADELVAIECFGPRMWQGS